MLSSNQGENIMPSEIIRVKLADLLVNIENPRFEPVQSEQEAIIEMAKNQRNKLIKLGQSIVKDGLNPSELPIIIPSLFDEDKFVVLEGNRRISVLKIIQNPDIIKPLINLYKQFESIKNNNLYSELDCVLFDDLDEANQWIELKHTGENEGIGTVRWNTIQKERFQNSLGKNPVAFQILQYAKNVIQLDPIVKQHIDDISLTNLERLIGDTYVKDFLGIEVIKRVVKSRIPEEELNKGLKRIITDLALKNINVNDIRKKEDRIDYIEKFHSRELPKKTTIYDNAWTLADKEPIDANQGTTLFDYNYQQANINQNSPTNVNITQPIQDNKNKINQKKYDDIKEEKINNVEDTLDKNGIKNESDAPNNKPNKNENNNIRSNRLAVSRKYLIPSNCILKIEHPRLNKIYYELKRLEVNSFENSVAVLFRVFLELSLDNYSNVVIVPSFNINDKLNVKIQKIADYMETNKLLTKYELKPVRTYISSVDNLFSTNTLNAYVHNKDVIPKADDLKATWDNYQKFIETIWIIK